MKINKKMAKDALGVFERTGADSLFVNSRFEFFTSENFAKNSVKSEKEFAKITKAEATALAGGESEEDAARKAAEVKKLGEATIVKLKDKVGEDAEKALADMKRSELDSLDSYFEADVAGQPNIDAARQVILDEINEQNNGES